MDLALLNIPSNKIKQLESRGIYSLPDLLKYIPRKYYDFRNITKISEIEQKEKEMCAFVARVSEMQVYGNGKVLSVKVTDGTGNMVLCWFHNVDMIRKILNIGEEYIFCGKPVIDREYHNTKKMSPILFNRNINKYRKLIPVYKKIQGMSDDYLKDLINTSLAFLVNSSDFISDSIKNQFGLIDEYEAFKKIHQPKDLEEIEKAKERFIFDDLFIWNFILKSKQSKNVESKYPATTCKSWHTLLPKLPFELTPDQINSLKQTYTLLKQKKRINALVQGDVGSGKTIVAEFILAACAENGFQSCLIAPTEVLAKQHYEEILERFEPLGYNVKYLAGGIKTKERTEILNGLRTGEVQVLIGTHAIMGKDVVFKNLGMVICDEEQRFGVLQREFYKKEDDFYIENMPYVSELNKTLKKLKAEKANIFFRSIDIEYFDINKELKLLKSIDTKDLTIEKIQAKVKKELEIILKEQQRIKTLMTDPKYFSLKKELEQLINDNVKTSKFFKSLTVDDIYALYYLYLPEITVELSKEIPIPHQITMSATPIPRTLAMSIYGDDVNVFTIKTRPNGRKPIATTMIKDNNRINDMLRQEISKGHQAYVVCPLIEDSESEKMAEVESVNSTYQYYVKEFRNDRNIKIGMISGDMKQDEINDIIDRYVKGEFKILVSTTIIEVGVNNPNSSIMVIKSSDRFGLSSLHQIRGRVGRSSIQSYCVLQPNNPDDKKAQIMCSTTDGFEISKYDLQMRGSGNLLGSKQSGENYYVSLMLAYPEWYEKIAKLNDKIYADKNLFNQYKYLLDAELSRD